MAGYYPCRVAPFGYLRLSACLTAPRSFSQLATPFIASLRLGIHHTPFVACPSSSSLHRRHATNTLTLNYPSSFSSFLHVKEHPLRPVLVEGSHRGKRPYALRVQSSQSSVVRTGSRQIILRKEVIQPQVPLRLPCYDFTPVTSRTLGGCPLREVGTPTSGTTDSHGVTGGVYKARERIHRGMLIRDY
jgi:hypothetical protein